MGSEILNNGLRILIFMSSVCDIATIVEEMVLEEIRPIVKEVVENELLLVDTMKKAESSFETLWDNDEDSAWDDV